jgi:hypothetical protein
MLNENAKKWVAALRSGEYKQGMKRLRVRDAMCCLGVACDLYSKEVGGQWEDGYFLGERDILPRVVADWLGLLDRGSHFIDKHDLGGDAQLSEMNDRGTSFTEIAAIIESEPEGLLIK